MSNKSRRRQQHDVVSRSKSMFGKAERELAEGYLEVEITGLTLRRLVAAYSVFLRTAWSHMMENLRSLLRPTPVH